jgi:glucan endo-1,6-beta-glucosidase
MIGIVNEPVQNSGTVETMLSSYYPNAYSVRSTWQSPRLFANSQLQAIRNAESAAGVISNNYFHVEPMNGLWGSGDPNQYMTNQYFMAYDDHRYTKYDSSVAVSQSAYMTDACTNNRNR